MYFRHDVTLMTLGLFFMDTYASLLHAGWPAHSGMPAHAGYICMAGAFWQALDKVHPVGEVRFSAGGHSLLHLLELALGLAGDLVDPHERPGQESVPAVEFAGELCRCFRPATYYGEYPK
jgi:hypothetical protein